MPLIVLLLICIALVVRGCTWALCPLCGMLLVAAGESDEELDARLWGSWDSPQALHEYWPETG